MAIEGIIRDERGLTTAGMAVSLLVALALLFSGVQVYRINTAAAEAQDVADAAALAAEGTVAEFMVAVRVVDGAVLSMTLLGVASYGLGVVGLCVPPAAEVGAELVSLGRKVLDARDALAQCAAASLDSLQRALPFMAAASAAAVARANGEGRAWDYHALALLLPAEGAPVAVGSNGAEADLEEEAEARADALSEAAARAEEAVRTANEAKERGFKRDCGDSPSACMYERAGSLAGLSGADNPLYASAEAWSFSVALERARAYYAARLRIEAPEGDAVQDRARSALRRNFYRYAAREVREACERGAGSEAPEFPRLPRNTEQMRATSLYTDPAYPITAEGGQPVMHAWEGCPEAGLVDRYGSVQTLEGGGFAECPACRFSASALGSVASASTAIDNGFEYHYDAVARAADDYRRALREAAPASDEAKGQAQELLDRVLGALRGSASARIEAVPPGADGCIVLLTASGGSSGADAPFTAALEPLGARAAVSAATLVEDRSDGASVVGDLLDGLDADGSAAVGAARIVLDCWSGLLGAYGDGQEALVRGVGEALAALPLAGSAGLGEWAADGLRSCLAEAGLEPAETAPLKPVLAGTGAVARADGGELAVRYLTVRDQVLAAPASSADPFASLADRIERDAYDRLASLEIEVACIDLPVGDVSVPITVTLPPVVAEGARGLVERAADAVRSVSGALGLERPWE